MPNTPSRSEERSRLEAPLEQPTPFFVKGEEATFAGHKDALAVQPYPKTRDMVSLLDLEEVGSAD